jgi:hypothetical protein
LRPPENGAEVAAAEFRKAMDQPRSDEALEWAGAIKAAHTILTLLTYNPQDQP